MVALTLDPGLPVTYPGGYRRNVHVMCVCAWGRCCGDNACTCETFAVIFFPSASNVLSEFPQSTSCFMCCVVHIRKTGVVVFFCRVPLYVYMYVMRDYIAWGEVTK